MMSAAYKDAVITRYEAIFYATILCMILLDKTYWDVKTTPEKGRGIFAKKDITPGLVIGDYIGKVIKTAEEDTSEKDGLYLLYYHDYASIYPADLNAEGFHLVNHSCTPNCWIYTYKGHTLLFTLRKIFAGEELTFSYLLNPDDYCTPCTHTCICGSMFCTGSMHLTKAQFTAWNAYNESIAKKTKRAPIRYGKVLPKLKDYPSRIEDHAIYTLFGTVDCLPVVYTETALPSIEELRKRIRQTGKTLSFPKLHKTIYGIKDGAVVIS